MKRTDGTGQHVKGGSRRSPKVRGNTLCRYIAHTIRAFRVLPWERSFLEKWLGTEGDAALSCARGNGKTGFVSTLCCAVVDPDGPLHGPGREVVLAASSFSQGRIVFDDILALLKSKIERGGTGKTGEWRIQDSANRATLEHRRTGARVKCIGSDPRRAHGLRPSLIIADELAQWENSKIDAMLAALRTSLGKVPGSRFLAIGTRPADDTHPFAKMLSGTGVDLAVSYAADDPSRVTWPEIKKANPSLSAMPDLRARIRAELADAKRDPALLAAFVSLRMNGGTSDVSEAVLLSAGTWKRIETPTARVRRPYVLAVDLGSTAAMSAAAGFSLVGGELEAFAVLPAVPDLHERGVKDGVGRLYLDMHGAGELEIAGTHTADPAELLRLALARWGRPCAIVADRWREGELREALDAARFPFADLVLRGQGFRDGAADVRAFLKAAVDGRLRPRPSLLLTSAMSEARTVSDPAGNTKLAKGTEGGRRKRGRDDAAAASILAVAEGTRRAAVRPKGFRRRLSLGAA